ncbi:MAG: hypothetical protein EAX95_14590 [Candidatus Thorarchaeota archaeon]|nr:hypothetical protein [Candidatus Thorarchaeota archaeon]
MLCVIVVVGLIATTIVVVSLNSREIIQDIEIQNADGATGTVFVVSRPGLTGFHVGTMNEFIRGLVDADWRVEVTTPSSQTLTNVTSYDLVILACPVNGASPHQAMQDYLARVDFGGRPVILVLTSGGEDASPAMGVFNDLVVDANGVVQDELSYWLLDGAAAGTAYTDGTQVTLGA